MNETILFADRSFSTSVNVSIFFTLSGMALMSLISSANSKMARANMATAATVPPAAAIESILRQRDTPLRLVVIDDATPGDAWVASLVQFRRDARLSVYRSDRNVGPYRLNNRILAEVETPFVAFQDADDLSEPDRLSIQLGILEKSGADMVGSSFRYISEEGTLISLKRMPRNVNLWMRLGRPFTLLHPTTVIKRSALTMLGGFDGTTRIAADTDFLLRAAPLLRIVNAPKFLYNYRLRGGSLTGDALTGHGSALRRAYVDAMRRRVKERRRNRSLRLLDESLLAPPNDVEFRLSPVRI